MMSLISEVRRGGIWNDSDEIISKYHQLIVFVINKKMGAITSTCC